MNADSALSPRLRWWLTACRQGCKWAAVQVRRHHGAKNPRPLSKGAQLGDWSETLSEYRVEYTHDRSSRQKQRRRHRATHHNVVRSILDAERDRGQGIVAISDNPGRREQAGCIAVVVNYGVARPIGRIRPQRDVIGMSPGRRRDGGEGLAKVTGREEERKDSARLTAASRATRRLIRRELKTVEPSAYTQPHHPSTITTFFPHASRLIKRRGSTNVFRMQCSDSCLNLAY